MFASSPSEPALSNLPNCLHILAEETEAETYIIRYIRYRWIRVSSSASQICNYTTSTAYPNINIITHPGTATDTRARYEKVGLSFESVFTVMQDSKQEQVYNTVDFGLDSVLGL